MSAASSPRQPDEVDTPAELIRECSDHDVLYRVGGACLVCEREGER